MEAMIVDFENSFILVLLSIFSLFFYFVFLRKTNKSRVDLGLPPSPPSLPIIGHLHHLLQLLPHKAFQKLSTKYGSLLYLRFFNFPVVLASSASVAYEIFKTQDVNVSSRGIAAIEESIMFGSSGFITAPYGDYWRFMKKIIVTKLLRPQAIEQSRGIRAEELKRFYDKLQEKAMKKESVDIRKETMKYTNNTTCRMSMGRSCSEEKGEAETVRKLIVKSISLGKKVFLAHMFRRPLEKLGISLFKKEIMDVSNKLDELLERILVEHEETLQEKTQDKDMMDLLLEAYRDKNAEYNITRHHMKSLFVEVFVGGTDTSAQATQWTMAELVNNQNVLEKLREEIDRVVGKTRMIQETDLPNLPYLQAVVKEGLRMHPPAPLFRMFQENCEVKGFFIPEKTTLVVNVYAIMRDPAVWEDPDVFKPERFLVSSKSKQEEEAKEQAIKYIPFGAGRRACAGANLAYLFIGTSVGMMVQCFDWRINGGYDKVNMEEAPVGVNLTMAHPLKCIPVPRLDPFSS